MCWALVCVLVAWAARQRPTYPGACGWRSCPALGTGGRIGCRDPGSSWPWPCDVMDSRGAGWGLKRRLSPGPGTLLPETLNMRHFLVWGCPQRGEISSFL